jgi:hypothetical protein
LVEWRLAGESKYSEKTCPSATLPTTNPTWLDPHLNPGRRGGKPATNRLSYGAAFLCMFLSILLGLYLFTIVYVSRRSHTLLLHILSLNVAPSTDLTHLVFFCLNFLAQISHRC